MSELNRRSFIKGVALSPLAKAEIVALVAAPPSVSLLTPSLFWSKDGTAIYADTGNGMIHKYSLTTPWDWSSSVYAASIAG
jgi:sugar lactone lactonase YvrE